MAEEITRNQDFLRTTFGVRDTPFLRPPYGARDERIDRIAADLGHPTVAMWNGTLDDSRVLTAEELLAAAAQWFTAADDRRRARQPPDGDHRLRRPAGAHRRARAAHGDPRRRLGHSCPAAPRRRGDGPGGRRLVRRRTRPRPYSERLRGAAGRDGGTAMAAGALAGGSRPCVPPRRPGAALCIVLRLEPNFPRRRPDEETA